MKKLFIRKFPFFAIFSIFLLGGGVFWLTQTAQGVNRTWDGGGTDGTCGGGAGDGNKWSCAANWSGDTAPTASDVAIFDGTSTKNATIDANISVAGISINSGYTGTITQSGSFTVTVGSSNYSQAVGTFTGGSGAIVVGGTFTLSGGTFTSTSGTLTIGTLLNADITYFTVSSGTFNHNNGTVTFSNSSLQYTYTVDVNTTLTLYDININTASSGAYVVTASGDTVIAANNFTHTNGKLSGTWEVQGNVIIASTADGGGATLTMTGTGAKTYTYTAGGVGPYLQVNNAGISVSAAGGTTDLCISSLGILAGTFTAPTGVLTIDASTRNNNITVFAVSGGTFSHNNGTVNFSFNVLSYTFTIDVNTSLTLYNVVVAITHNGAAVLTTASGDTIIVANNFTHTNGKLAGTWEVQGNYTVATTADGGTADITFTGGNAQTYTDQGGNEPDGDVLINKSAGTVTLASGADWNATNQDVTITAGTLASATYNITTNNFTVNGGTFTGGSGTVTVNGSFALSSGAFTSTTGTLSVLNNFTHTAGGTFSHNNGTVAIGTYGVSPVIDVATSETFNNLTMQTHCGTCLTTISSGDTLVVLGTFNHVYGLIYTGTIEARGNIIIGAGAGGGEYGYPGSATLSLLVAGDQTITGSGGITVGLNINKPSGTVSVSGDLGTNSFALTGGTFISTTGTFTILNNFTHTAGGTFDHNGGTVAIGTYGTTSVIDVATTETFNDVTFQAWGGGGSHTISSGDTMIVLGTFNHVYGQINTGTIEARGNVTIGAGATGGTGTLSFTGGNNQTYTDQGGNETDGDIIVNKTPGSSVTLASNADWNATNQDVTITSGELNMGASYNLSTTTLTVATDGHLSNNGTGDLTLAGNVSNSGNIRFRSNGTCGGTDDILIRSSSTGVQRSWNGTGIFTLQDVDVRDMAGSATITLYSSTNTANNGANWTFSGAACPTQPPQAGLSSGKMNMQSGKINLR